MKKPKKQNLIAAHKLALLAKRDAWLSEIDPAYLFHRLFDELPGVYFFAKNRSGELMFMSQNNRDLCRIPDEATVVGLTDFDLNPSDMAKTYVEDDAQIYATGQPLLNRVELWFDRLRIPDWFVVNKVPIRSRDGQIIGVMGFSQSYDGRAKLMNPFEGLTRAVSHVRNHYGKNITVPELARIAALSPQQLERKFKATFGVGPRQFLVKTRLLAGCRLLRETQQPIAEIAYACGFADQSAFTRQFRHHLGTTPTGFRNRQPRIGGFDGL